MKTTFKVGAAALSFALLASTVMADDKVYADFPITVKGYEGKKTTSVSYTGQIARQTLHDSLKKLAGQGNGKPNAELKAKMLSYFEGKDAGRAILAPKSKGAFVISQTEVDAISKKKNLSGKTYKGVIVGMPNGLTGEELVKFWIEKASEANKGVDLANGYNYPQLISKFIMGAVLYNQAVDNYLDEKLAADTKPNDKPYSDGAAYTGKEHVWDEAFGYFGTPAHTMTLTAKQVYEIAKLGSASKDAKDALMYADYNKDGKVDLKTEAAFGPAYYAAGFDKGGKTTYLHTITEAFIDGRALIASAKGEKLTDAQRTQLKGYADTIAKNWEMVLAEATFKYAGSVYKDMAKLQVIMDANGETDKQYKAYVKHWGELKGFALALQTGKSNMGEASTKLNRLIGAGPLLLNASQVTDIDRKGNYLRDQTISWGEYMLHMAKVQKLMVDAFGVKAKSNDVTKEMAELIDKLGDSLTAEND
ncbi:DUF4856 domain-containing protein [Terasakiella sp. A23]|uniref:DUF4856 domain-containing protein n=1 Tax=Terasakiella sp. FCG-A23 TaxID=3080561 RepID=UPI00295551E4|nr:DUF4856 domain-containing protein [Terasakiella sp. A23]MDV7341292.1 DUF4856 domain-containing protein [Terasakiella sp. A23]